MPQPLLRLLLDFTPTIFCRSQHVRLFCIAFAGGMKLYFEEIDRRSMEPRQLAGEDGSAEHGEESLDTPELSREWLFDADADAIRSGEALDDPVNADRAAPNFKPKCLGIQSSIDVNPANAERRPQVYSEHVLATQSTSFD
ncbi:hypothetical protein JQ580_24855 [Bradyrhizobium japonicum]|uniref:hypothetical protein n=1 Tax=Bradyrhizobium japonicum TaxID=375 RepID=UPI001BA9A7A3|nr:hypothetical protein [Bradyrhizobium japonicum]MBR0993958.1 hypothetical protein [Bradyrhizobium japonicum]